MQGKVGGDAGENCVRSPCDRTQQFKRFSHWHRHAGVGTRDITIADSEWLIIIIIIRLRYWCSLVCCLRKYIKRPWESIKFEHQRGKVDFSDLYVSMKDRIRRRRGGVWIQERRLASERIIRIIVNWLDKELLIKTEVKELRNEE